MNLLILNTGGYISAYPFDKITNVDLYTSETNGVHDATVSLKIEGRSAAITPYNESGDASIVAPAEKLYRDILDGMANDKTVNLTDFTLTAPKKAPAKKAPVKKTEPEPEPEPEAPAEQPSE